MDKQGVFGFLSLFGYFLVRVLARVRVLSGRSACSGCSGISVENLCKRVWESLWGRSGKVGGKTIDSHFRISFLGKSEVLHGIVEKFYYKFCTGFSLCKRGFLHSFHRVYYYNYYFLYRGKEI